MFSIVGFLFLFYLEGRFTLFPSSNDVLFCFLLYSINCHILLIALSQIRFLSYLFNSDLESILALYTSYLGCSEWSFSLKTPKVSSWTMLCYGPWCFSCYFLIWSISQAQLISHQFSSYSNIHSISSLSSVSSGEPEAA